ncbi:hypothetical protein ZYGR_0AZ00490 [Zygosaccharomyces rouxii]|uniref:Uncharacterized protein n=1 Tax=Zygosaccharomyces rouxii TaxID=4956 RepID=A0A1Q3AJH7_ZYGRO|nr:hypothetical protein ZYGR_0AZ00490 [Zygosaccharomyces rouxii]
MKFPTALALLHLSALGIAAPICSSGEESSSLLLDGEEKDAAIKLYHEKYADAKVPEGPLKVTKSSDGSLKINFEDTQQEPAKVNCAEVKGEGEDEVTTEGFSGGGGGGGGSLFSGLNNWTINWNGPNLNLNLPSRASMRFPTFNLEGITDETK